MVTHEATGSCDLMEINGQTGLKEHGTELGKYIFVNQPIPVNAAELEFVLLTHAHIDHIGNLPLLYKIRRFLCEVFWAETAGIIDLFTKNTYLISYSFLYKTTSCGKLRLL